MELPNELWNLIAYNLKFELDLYKNCALVNKQLYYIIKQLYERIPSQLHIKTSSFLECPYRKVRYDFVSNTKITYDCTANEVGTIFVIHKNEILKNNKYEFCYYLGRLRHQYAIFCLVPNIFFSDDLQQKCNYIQFVQNINGFHLYYYEDKFL